jgi:hypothetical protein
VAHASDPAFLVLHAVRLKGFASVAAVGGATGLSDSDAGRILEELAAEGLVRHREGSVTGWASTGQGRDEHARQVALELDAAGCKSVVDDAYRAFVGLNPTLKQVCTAWQVRDLAAQQANDHRDSGYDESDVQRLVALDRQIEPVLARLTQSLERFSRYRPRLASALARVRAGEREWFTRPVVDSYHTVWMELHEDLLHTLALDRSGEDGC